MGSVSSAIAAAAKEAGATILTNAEVCLHPVMRSLPLHCKENEYFVSELFAFEYLTYI
uniref:Phytoene dehydrogenase n=1 Tax=Solanum tuberosum TaxID=4113 RepID=M0ZVG0_SOLTU